MKRHNAKNYDVSYSKIKFKLDGGLQMKSSNEEFIKKINVLLKEIKSYKDKQIIYTTLIVLIEQQNK